MTEKMIAENNLLERSTFPPLINNYLNNNHGAGSFYLLTSDEGTIHILGGESSVIIGSSEVFNNENFYERFKKYPDLIALIDNTDQRKEVIECSVDGYMYSFNVFSLIDDAKSKFVIGTPATVSSGRLLEDVFRNLHNGVIITDKRGGIEWVNDGFVKMSGYTLEEALGKKPGDLLQGKETNPKHKKQFQAKLKKGVPFAQEIINYSKSGKMFWSYVQITPILNDLGGVEKYVGIETDITKLIKYQEKLKRSELNMRKIADDQTQISAQLKEAENKVRKALEEKTNSLKQLEEAQSQIVSNEKMASLGQLTAGIAHEINNPIAFVFNGIDALKYTLEGLFEIAKEINSFKETKDKEALIERIDEFQQEFDIDEIITDADGLIDDIKNGAVRTMEIVKGLRIFSRLDEEEFKLANINENLDATLILLNSKIKKRIKLNKEYDLDLPEINCFPGQLNQVFMNLVNNAIQAFPEDHEDATIDVITRATSDGVSISIKDNGTGIPEDVKKRVFEPFFTTKPVGIGTGLGLSISYGIIEKHEGKIELFSTEGEGTEFKISLPFRA